MNPFTPSYDNKIARKYSQKTLDQKVHNKTAFQEALGWPKETKQAILCIPSGIVGKQNGAFFEEIVPGILSQNIALLIVGKGEKKFGEIATQLSKDHTHRIAIVKNDEQEIRKMYAASDMALFLGSTKDDQELEHCLQYGVVPIAPESELLQNYNAIQETGNAFIYTGTTVWHRFAAIVRAMETFNFPYDYRTIQRHCMDTIKE